MKNSPHPPCASLVESTVFLSICSKLAHNCVPGLVFGEASILSHSSLRFLASSAVTNCCLRLRAFRAKSMGPCVPDKKSCKELGARFCSKVREAAGLTADPPSVDSLDSVQAMPWLRKLLSSPELGGAPVVLWYWCPGTNSSASSETIELSLDSAPLPSSELQSTCCCCWAVSRFLSAADEPIEIILCFELTRLRSIPTAPANATVRIQVQLRKHVC